MIYNDRVNTWREMKVLNAELDDKPTEAKVAKMAETRIRNLQCFEELRSFNNTEKWKNKHPLLIHYSERFQLEELRRRDPAAFLRKYANCQQNIKRYKSYLNNKSRADQHEGDKKNLVKHQERQVIFETILNDERNNYL